MASLHTTDRFYFGRRSLINNYLFPRWPFQLAVVFCAFSAFIDIHEWMDSDAHALHAHVARLMPTSLSTTVTHSVSLFELCMHAGRGLESDLATLGLQAPAVEPCVDHVEIRQLSFQTPRPQYVTRFLPYTESAHVLSLRKRNLSMDEAEGFVAIDDSNRSLNVLTSVNAAYFLQDRCSVCGAELDSGKQTHTCAFFCVAACQLEQSGVIKTAVAYVEFNLLASARDCPSSSIPCVSVHVLSPSRVVLACFTVIDALQIFLRTALGVGIEASLQSAAAPVPFPTFLRRGMLRVYVTCLHAVVALVWLLEKERPCTECCLPSGSIVCARVCQSR